MPSLLERQLEASVSYNQEAERQRARVQPEPQRCTRGELNARCQEPKPFEWLACDACLRGDQ